jgi:hypothetical protein
MKALAGIFREITRRVSAEALAERLPHLKLRPVITPPCPSARVSAGDGVALPPGSRTAAETPCAHSSPSSSGAGQAVPEARLPPAVPKPNERMGDWSKSWIPVPRDFRNPSTHSVDLARRDCAVGERKGGCTVHD